MKKRQILDNPIDEADGRARSRYFGRSVRLPDLARMILNSSGKHEINENENVRWL